MLNNIDEDEKTKKVTPIYNVYNGQYENQECLFLTVDEDEKLKRVHYTKTLINLLDLKNSMENLHSLLKVGYTSDVYVLKELIIIQQ